MKQIDPLILDLIDVLFEIPRIVVGVLLCIWLTVTFPLVLLEEANEKRARGRR